jgi:nicotinamidase-related amidase
MAARSTDVREALLVVDAISGFDHADGDHLLASLRERAGALQAALRHARAAGLPVLYVNDAYGIWDGDGPGAVRRALAGPGGDVIAGIAPQPGDLFVFKDGYAAIGGTPVESLLRERDVTRIVLAGAATEMCVAQTAITAREHGFQVTVLADACAHVREEDEQIALAYLERVTGSWVRRVDEWVSGRAG